MSKNKKINSALPNELHKLRQQAHCLQMLKVLLDTADEVTERKDLLSQLQIIISNINNTLKKIDLPEIAEENKKTKSNFVTKSSIENQDISTNLVNNSLKAFYEDKINDSNLIGQKNENDFSISIVDDDIILRSSTRKLLERLGWDVTEFNSAEMFLNSDYYHKKGCLLIDQQLPKMNGNKLISNLRKAGCRTPCIMITGEGNIQLAVDTMKAGANDFLEKPFDINVLHQKLVHFQSSYNELLEYDLSKKINTEKFKLTKREREILEQILSGDSNKVIARKIGLSHRTIENHRSSIMKKTKSNSIMDLVRNVLIK